LNSTRCATDQDPSPSGPSQIPLSGIFDARRRRFVVRIYRVAARVYVDGMRLRSLSITLGLGIGLGLAAAPARAQKAVFVVRHAEKVSEQDQSLTEAGRARARRPS
jgi:hypothetical protein